MNDDVFALWVYLARTPLLWLTVTILVYCVCDGISAALRRTPLANPVLISMCLVGILVRGTGTPYATYFDGAQFIHFLLGPATVALAIPLYQHRRLVVQAILPMACALIAGSLTALVSAVVIARLLGASPAIVTSIAPKSVTAAVAMGISGRLGGDPGLTAVLVILTGILGAIVVTPLMNCCELLTSAPAALPPAWRHTASAPRGPFRSILSRVLSPGSPWA